MHAYLVPIHMSPRYSGCFRPGEIKREKQEISRINKTACYSADIPKRRHRLHQCQSFKLRSFAQRGSVSAGARGECR